MQGKVIISQRLCRELIEDLDSLNKLRKIYPATDEENVHERYLSNLRSERLKELLKVSRRNHTDNPPKEDE